MNGELEHQLLKVLGAKAFSKVELVQSLWSDFGALERIYLNGSDRKSIVIKRIQPPSKMHHPRGWNTDASSQRKIKSYEIERLWYEKYAANLPTDIKVPEFLFYFEQNGESILAMEALVFALVYGKKAKHFRFLFSIAKGRFATSKRFELRVIHKNST